ncbi:DUF3566 domain-containing protein [Streptomyces sp. J2-1]|uniref:DUF3566 domain-containing protein n=1 Tax=Streptomyces corallincola TaxID=2851888 RepID=UPI001C394B17|nr:DUF3566 domain-containing protein [Streptomyces corallincola]MBV2354970.1 DUF3566 domain-containing protein [Streptomyces corallincola]
MRISEADPWSVTVTSFLFLTGLGASVLLGMVILAAVLDIVAPGEWPGVWTTLVIGGAVAVMEIVLGTALASLSTFIYNMTAQYSGGVEVAVTDDLSDPTPAAARAYQYADRLRTRVRRRIAPGTVSATPYSHGHGDSSQPAAQAGNGPQRP